MYKRSKQGEINRLKSIPRGKNHWNYNENCSVLAIHRWLNKNFGKPYKCESKNCKNKSKVFDLALKKGKKYERKRENFLMLCRSCHKKYDITEETKTKIMVNLAKNKGIKMSDEQKEKIRKSMLGNKNKLGKFKKTI